LAARRAADIEQNRALGREVEQQRSRADALAREAASRQNERDAARIQAFEATARADRAEAAREKEPASSGKAPPPALASAGDRLAAWNASAAVVAPSPGGSARAPSQGVVQPPASPSPKPPASAATPPEAKLTTGASSAPAATNIAAAERSIGTTAAPRALANEERLLARASTLLRQADINAARGLLEYVLERGSAKAAFMLAETYDPHMLQSWDVRGVAGDPVKARELYERARAGGIRDADGRIVGLR
jgi:hypothetical protein